MTQSDDLERRVHRVRAHVALRTRARPSLLEVLAGQDAERNRHRERRRKPRKCVRDGVRENVEVGRLAPYQAPKRNDRIKASRLGDGRDGGREL